MTSTTCYSVTTDPETMEAVIDLPRTVAADARRAAESGRARLQEAREGFRDLFRAVGERDGLPYDESESREAKFLRRTGESMDRTTDLLRCFLAVIRFVPDDCQMDPHSGEAWIELQKRLREVENLRLGIAAVRNRIAS